MLYAPPPAPPVIPGVRLRFIDGWPDYLVGDDGSVWTHKPIAKPREGLVHVWRRMTTPPHKCSGYRFATLVSGTKKRTTRVHVLVLETFVGPRPPGMESLHRDGDRTNARLDNLSWGTHAQNTEDRGRHGNHLAGSRNPFAKLDEAKARQAFILLRAGRHTQEQIAASFGVKTPCINKLARGRSWTHVTGLPRPQPVPL